MVSKRASGSHIELDNIHGSTNKEAKFDIGTQLKVEKTIKETEIPPLFPHKIW